MRTAPQPYQYTEVSDCPAKHREVLMHAVYGLNTKQLSEIHNISLDTVERILNHEPNASWLAAQRAAVAADTAQAIAGFQQIVQKTVKLHEKLLDGALREVEGEDGVKEWKPSVSEATQRKLLDAGYDHDPQGHFAKQSKQTINVSMQVFGGIQIKKLREEMGREMELGAPKIIDVLAQEAETKELAYETAV